MFRVQETWHLKKFSIGVHRIVTELLYSLLFFDFTQTGVTFQSTDSSYNSLCPHLPKPDSICCWFDSLLSGPPSIKANLNTYELHHLLILCLPWSHFQQYSRSVKTGCL